MCYNEVLYGPDKVIVFLSVLCNSITNIYFKGDIFMSERKLFTSESVSEGHPDKIADQISDAILDAILEQDPEAHVAAETAVYTGSVHVFGEISTTAYVDINRVVRDTIAEIGYTNTEYGFSAETVGVHPSLVEQSPDIAQGVNEALKFVEMRIKTHSI